MKSSKFHTGMLIVIVLLLLIEIASDYVKIHNNKVDRLERRLTYISIIVDEISSKTDNLEWQVNDIDYLKIDIDYLQSGIDDIESMLMEIYDATFYQ